MYNASANHLISILTKKYYPFNLLSPQRLEKLNDLLTHEVGSTVRFIEMRQGEIFQILGSSEQDYLFVINGSIDLSQPTLMRSATTPSKTRKEPLKLLASPASSTIVARNRCTICHVDRDFLDDLIAWDEITSVTSEYEKNKYIDKMRNSSAFRRLPLECVEEACKRMYREKVNEGQIIINQGERSQHFYLIIEGSATSYQAIKNDFLPEAEPMTLVAGDVFSDEALVADNASEKTVKMLSDGILLVLKEDDFQELVSKELVRQVHPSIVKSMLDTGYKLIDVRYDIEHEESFIPKSILIPLHELRLRMHELDKTEQYVVYCRSGRRSAVAVMMLRQNKFEAVSLQGGIRDWPYDIERREFY